MQRTHGALALLHGLFDRGVAARAGEREQAVLHFLQRERLQLEGAEEIIERLIHVSNLGKVARGSADEHHARLLHQEGAQAVQRLGIADGGEHVVEVVDEQQGASAAAGDGFEKEFSRLVLDVGRWRVEQRLGAVGGIVGRVFPLPDRFEPKIGEVADAPALLVEHHGLPRLREFRIARDAVRDGPKRGGLAHAARAHEQHVLGRMAGSVLPNRVEQGVEQRLPGDKFAEQRVRGEQRGVVERKGDGRVHRPQEVFRRQKSRRIFEANRVRCTPSPSCRR